MNLDSSFLTYFMNAGLVVKLVLLLLICASMLSWTYILQRYFFIKQTRQETAEFESRFWSGGDLSKMYADVTQSKTARGMSSIFQAGFKEFLRLRKHENVTPDAMMEGARRAMKVAQMHEQDELDTHLPVLATVGSISPYVGLFGTVWGLMLSLSALANVQQATISMVAPGMAEALIATAMGLFAAIPATVAYNRFTNESNRILNRYDAFQDEFSNILFRQCQQSSNQMAEVEG